MKLRLDQKRWSRWERNSWPNEFRLLKFKMMGILL